MSSLFALASTAGEKTLWDPTILGILVVLSAVGLFCGSVYLLLATNMGGRLGFLVAAACLTGFMVLLSSLWITTATPLNSPRGRLASWEVVGVTDALAGSDIAEIRSIARDGRAATEDEVSNLRAAIDAALVTADATHGEVPEQPFALYGASGDFLTDFDGREAWIRGGGTSNVFWHHPRYAAVQFCDTREVPEIAGEAPPAPRCDPLSATQFALLRYDYGSLRQTPWAYFTVSLVLFVLSLLGLHWYEKDQRARKAGTVATKA